ncbi:MAG TPA: carboxypeptidase regulatory-like domain-containing protein [Candidatus Sulfotelmatobacter sp.]|nr:carboxypeptidase regulatory-like domain-containing protein [Candidatus Sulfotelmatobacter sp.]
MASRFGVWWIGILFSVILLTLLGARSAAAENGTLNGVVSDPTGSAIVGAKVTLRAMGSNEVSAEAMTQEDGKYVVAVAAGRYDLEVSAASFRPFQRAGVEISAGAEARIDAQLSLESHAETVTVVEESLVPDVASTMLGEELKEKKIESVPLNGRNFTDLMGLQTGILPASSAQPNAVVMSGVTSTPPSGDLQAGNLSVSGQRETSNGFAVNNSDVEEDVNMGTAIVPNLDSIQEMQVLTGNFEAQYGNYSGGQVLLTTKSGTDAFHGSAFEFLRNTDLDAKSYFSPTRADFDQNQFGGTFGGPVNKHSLYFFGDYQGTRMTQGVDTGRISVPSGEERSGDFMDRASALTGEVSGPYLAELLSQKLGYAVSAGEPYYVAGCSGASRCVFPNAVIPESAWSAPALSLLQYIPQANQGASIFSTSGENQGLRDDKGAMRLDDTTRWGSFSAYYFVDDYQLDNPYPTAQGGANVPGFNAISEGRAQLLSLGFTKVISGNAINEAHFSYMRNSNDIGAPVGGVGPSLASQGFLTGEGTVGIVPLNPSIEGIENVSLNSLTFGVDVTGLTQASNTYQWSDVFSRVVGQHTLKFGGSLHLDQINTDPDTASNGSFAFRGTETGLDFADFLLGIASSYSQADSKSFYPRNEYVGLFAQDTWRIKPNLTWNYGLRWDVLPGWREKYNQFPGLVLGEQSEVFPGAPKGLVFPGDPGVPSTLAPTKYTNFAPRLGLAYAPEFHDGWLHKLLGDGQQTRLVAGFGTFYTAFEGLSAGIMSANPPYGYDYTSLAPVLFATPFVSAASGRQFVQPFPSPIPAYGASPNHPNTSVDWSKYLPITGVPAFDRANLPPYAETYTLSVERQLGRDTLLTVSYVGSQAHHLLVIEPANPGNAAACLSVSEASQVAPGSATCGPFSEGGLFTTASGQTTQVRGPFSAQFDAITYQKTIGSSNYNSLQINLRHHSKNLEVLAGYTYSKSLDDSSSLAEEVNPIDPGLSRALSAFDLRHNFVVSYNYSLPGQVLGHRNHWTEGWSISGVTRLATGLPVTFYNNNDTSLIGSIPNGINNNGLDTPERVAGNLQINNNPRNGRPAFDTALFSLPALGDFGMAGRRFFSGPGMVNFDLAVQKNLPLTESKSLQFRVETFNTLNHAQFFGAAAVDGNISDATFGQIVNSMPPRLMQLAMRLVF